MAITRGQKAPTAGSTPGGTATQAVTFGTNPASGSAILVAITMWVNGTASVSSVTDNGSPANTYSLVTDGTTTAHAGPTGASDATWIYKADSIHLPSSGSLVVTAHLTGPAGGYGVTVFAEELIGAATGNVQQVVNHTGTANPMTAAATTGSANSLYWGVGTNNDAGTTNTWTFNNSFVDEGSSTWGSGNKQALAVASKGFGGGTSGAQTWSVTDNTTISDYAATVIVVASSGGIVSGSGSGAMVFAGSATGIVKVTGSGSGALAFGGSATGSTIIHDTGSGALTFSGSATARSAVQASGSGALTFSGSATGGLIFPGHGQGAVAFHGAAAPQSAGRGGLNFVGLATPQLPVAAVTGSHTAENMFCVGCILAGIIDPCPGCGGGN